MEVRFEFAITLICCSHFSHTKNLHLARFHCFHVIGLTHKHTCVSLQDKKYYPTAQEVYGEDVETLVQEEDTMELNEPIIAPVKRKHFAIVQEDLPDTTYDKELVG